jgi:hypothetical protein
LKPTKPQTACTPIGRDPYETGLKRNCCNGGYDCLRKWVSTKSPFYKCTSSQATCSNGLISSAPTSSASG